MAHISEFILLLVSNTLKYNHLFMGTVLVAINPMMANESIGFVSELIRYANRLNRINLGPNRNRLQPIPCSIRSHNTRLE